MRLRDGRYECTLCGAVLSIPTDQDPRVTITTATGAKTMRTISYDGKAIHSCPLRGPEKVTSAGRS